MNSMNYIGRIVSNFREFYNEINAATLTGAIDVVVVEQPDGTFNCSPFHVRFGKLGVLRSREKVVDIEINGEPQDIHMKLGDSGEAFFVEEVLNSDTELIPEHLATSPIPVSEFEKLYVPEAKPRRKSIDLGYNIDDPAPVLENQVNDYSKRRYTDSHGQDYSLKKRDFVTRQIGLGNIELGEQSNEDLSLSRADSISVNKQSDEDFNQDSEMSETIFKMDSLEADHTPKETPIVEEKPDIPKLDIPKVEEPEKSEFEVKSNNKKRRRKKSMIKKKNTQRKTSVTTELKEPDLTDNSQLQSSEPVEVKMTESITDKSSLGSSQSEHDLISGSDSTMNSRMIGRDPDFLFFSDTELTANSERNSRPNTPVQSDTEFEVSQRKENDQPAGQSWDWGQLPNAPKNNDMTSSIHEERLPESEATKQAERNSMLSSMFSFMKQNKRMRHNGSPEGMYLADLSSGTLDPEVAALYFPNTRTERHTDADNDCESGNGPSLPQSPNSVEGAKSIDSDYEDHKNDSVTTCLQDISLSLCGWTEHPTEDAFIRHVVSFTDLCNNPSLLESPDLVVRISDKYYSWRAATPVIISMLVYHRTLPSSTIEQLCSMHMPTITMQDKSQKSEPRGYSWWSWRRKGDRTPSTEAAPDIVPAKPDEAHVAAEEEVSVKEEEISAKTVDTLEVTPVTADNTSFVPDGLESQCIIDDNLINKSDLPIEMTQSMYGEKFRKTLRLSSEQIKKLNLNEGMNEVEFSVTTAYQGTSRCKCHIYRWRYDDKIVISDIDGTITKSDVLGHILPIVGKDWAQSGVAQLFTKIKNNGYKLLYLSARAIGQARVTREYLRSIKQGNLSLPDGPLLLNPTSLISAFHREVIEKKPEQFKISCLSDIQALFPAESNPFYAGYGNRINDVWAYRAVGIPIVRIFTINHKGELKHELTQTFQSSYSNMTSFVDQLFPAFLEAANEYSQFVYWREPIANIEEEIPLPALPVK